MAEVIEAATEVVIGVAIEVVTEPTEALTEAPIEVPIEVPTEALTEVATEMLVVLLAPLAALDLLPLDAAQGTNHPERTIAVTATATTIVILDGAPGIVLGAQILGTTSPFP